MTLQQSYNVFTRQNFWLKLTIMFFGLAATIAVPFKALLFLLAITLLYLCLSFQTLKQVLKGIRILLPFLAVYSVMALFFNLTFPDMITFIIRLLILVLLVVYFSASTPLHRFLEDTIPTRSNPQNSKVLFYCVATTLFLNRFMAYYKNNSKISKSKGYNVSKLIPALTDAIHDNWQKRDDIEQETESILSVSYTKPTFINKSNTLGCAYLTMLLLILSL